MDLIDEFTLKEQIDFHFQLKKVRNNLSTAELIELMYLEKSANKLIGNFSSGMKQRVKLGLAFYSKSDIIFLDEPGTNLDRNAFDWYIRELGKVPPQSLVIIASNNPSEYPMTSQMINISDYKS
jgi:ABC-type multidrug transport system ATPase subunit